MSSAKRATSKWCSPWEGGPAPLLALGDGAPSLAAAHPELSALGLTLQTLIGDIRFSARPGPRDAIGRASA